MHFTYEEDADTNRQMLRQGDLLRRTEAINKLLETVHPHYHQQADYKFLQVLTQSCDLERRNGDCSTRYVTLAAVRPLSLVVLRELDEYRNDFERAAHVVDAGCKSRIERFIEHLLNNNDSRYFYLHEQPEVGLSEPYCTFLHLSIAVRAGEHYDTCLGGKLLQLRPDFQAKLGWLVGNLYSRVGTEDWVPDTETAEEFRAHVERLVNEVAIWVDRKKLQKLRTALTAGGPIQESIPVERVKAIVNSLIIPTRQEQVLERLRELLPQFGLDAAGVKSAVNVLRSDPVFSQLIKER